MSYNKYFYGVGALSLALGTCGLYASIKYYIEEYKVAKKKRKEEWMIWWEKMMFGLKSVGVAGLLACSMYVGFYLRQMITKKLK